MKVVRPEGSSVWNVLSGIFSGLLLLTVAGCAFIDDEPLYEPLPKVEEVELELSRASLLEAEFEHFKIRSGLLFVECGVERYGRRVPDTQVVDRVPPSHRGILLERSAELLSVLEKDNPSWRKPGDNTSISDPGKLSFRVEANGESYAIETSLDSIASPSSRGEQRLKSLVEAIRGSAASAPCRNNTFFGLRAVGADGSQKFRGEGAGQGE